MTFKRVITQNVKNDKVSSPIREKRRPHHIEVGGKIPNLTQQILIKLLDSDREPYILHVHSLEKLQ